MKAQLPIFIARCEAALQCCPQASRCARFLDDSFDDNVHFIDASAALTPRGCALFIDIRGASLLQPKGVPSCVPTFLKPGVRPSPFPT